MIRHREPGGPGRNVPTAAVNAENKVWYLKQSRVFERAGDDVLTGCEHFFTAVPRAKKYHVFQPGDPAGAVYFIKRGRVRISRITSDGKEVTVAVLGPGDVFGEEALFGEAERATLATVIQDALICTSRAEDLFSLIARHPVLSLNIARYLREQRDEAVSAVEDIAFLKVPDRIMRLFERLAEEHGVDEPGGRRLDLHLTHADVASLVGSTRETVSLELSRLVKAGRLVVRERRFVLPRTTVPA